MPHDQSHEAADAELLAGAWLELNQYRDLLADLGAVFAAAGHELYLVGGSVRDALMGRGCTDLDFTTDARPEQMQKLLRSWGDALWDMGIEFGTVGVGISGYNDFRDLIEGGRLRALAVVAPERLEGVDTPTMEELGYEEVDLVNWRGLVAPPGISDAQRRELEDIVDEMVATDSWGEAVETNRWVVNPAEGEEFEDFVASEQKRINELMKELGLV